MKTTKKKIIDAAKENPWRKVADIADIADTSERYVRTVLSEQQISLTQLRRESYEELREKVDNQPA